MEELRKRGRKASEPIPQERLLEIRQKLWQYGLNYTWLLHQLRLIGVDTCKEDISMYLCGRRKGKKAEEVVNAALGVLDKYAQSYC